MTKPPADRTTVDVFDNGQPATAEREAARSITAASVADMVSQINRIEAPNLALRLHGLPKTGGHPELDGPDRAWYVSLGRRHTRDRTGDYSLQLDPDGFHLKGSAGCRLAEMKNVTQITFMDASCRWSMALFWAVARSMHTPRFEVRAHGQTEAVFGENPEFEPIYLNWLAAQEAALPAGRRRVTARLYTVAPGDSLPSISAKFYGTPQKWKSLYEANKVVIGPNPQALRPGLQLSV